jgi:hypothetical protein
MVNTILLEQKYKIQRKCEVNKLIAIETQIKHILGPDFTLEKIRYDKFLKNRKMMFYMHKSENRKINIELQQQGREEQDRIRQIILLKRISETSSAFINYEFYAYGLEKKQELALKKLSLVKTKICLTQIFL